MKILGRNIIRIRKLWPKTLTRWKTDKASALYDCGPDLQDRSICALDPLDPDKCYTEPRVVIIGAGMAGLSAAARLAKRGITNLVVLEAYERPGGRIQSCWIGDVVAELGATIQESDNSSPHPVYTMSAKEIPPRPGLPGVEHSRGLFNRVVTGKMPFPSTITAYYKFRQIEEEASRIFCLGGSKQHGSLINFMSLRIQQELHEYPEDQQHDAARILFGLAHMFSARCVDDTAMLYGDHSGCYMNMPGGDVRVPLGVAGSMAPFLRQIPEGAIRYCKPVNCVYWGTSQKSGCRATVCTTDGEEFPADYVIITVSVGVLAANAAKLFCPALPSSKMDAIRCLGFGFVNKIYMEYCHPFWYWHNADINFNYTSSSLMYRTDWSRGIRSIRTAPNSNHVISVMVVGKEAWQLETICDKDVAEGVTDLLRVSTGNSYIPYPVTLIRSHWNSDPYFLCAYSYDCECTDGDTQRALACPLPGLADSIPPILLFAGEATVPGYSGTLEGAKISGVREAERIIQLTLRFKGPPLPATLTMQSKNKIKCVN